MCFLFLNFDMALHKNSFTYIQYCNVYIWLSTSLYLQLTKSQMSVYTCEEFYFSVFFVYSLICHIPTSVSPPSSFLSCSSLNLFPIHSVSHQKRTGLLRLSNKYDIRIRLRTFPHSKAGGDNLVEGQVFQRRQKKKITKSSYSHCSPQKRIKIHNCRISAKGLGCIHAGSLSVESQWSSMIPSLFILCFFFLVVSLTI